MNVLTTVSKMALRLSSLQRTWIWEVHRKAAASCGEWRKAWKCPISGHLARVKWLRSGSRYEKQSEDLESELLSHSSAWSLAPSPQCLSALPLNPTFCVASSFFEANGHLLSEHVCVSVKDPNAPRTKGGITAKFSQGTPFKNLCKKY